MADVSFPQIEIVEESVEALPEYGKISIAFTVETRLRVEPIDGGLGGLKLVEEEVQPPTRDVF